MVHSSRTQEVADRTQHTPVNTAAAADAEHLGAPCDVETDTGGVDDGEY
jgi:hypothetical protein